MGLLEDKSGMIRSDLVGADQERFASIPFEEKDRVTRVFSRR
jgi:hypothetical protein